MSNFIHRAKSFCRDEDGATMVEYGILVDLLSVVSITGIAAVGLYVKGTFTKVESELQAAGVPQAAP